jgi:RHS repeat-associated protein
MDASSIPYKLSLCADRAHACAGDSYVSSAIDVACTTTQRVIAIASPHELHGDSWPSSPTGTSSFCCNQQYSITAVTTSSGAIAERYAYSAYGEPTILDASASVLSSSAINNRYTYTGREWDATLGLYHFRARWMSGLTGRFLSTDPVKYLGSEWNLFAYCENKSLNRSDPYGLCSRWPLCGGKPLDRRFNCCENDQLVPLVSLWRCVQNKYLGLGRCWDYTVGWVACPLGLRARHSYVCCDGSNKNCFDADNMRPRAMWPSCSGPYWQPYDPAKIDTAWIHFDGTCTEWKVCPAEKESYCKPAVIPFSLFGPNCHHNAGNWGGTWNW